MKPSPNQKHDAVAKKLRKKTGGGLEQWMSLVKHRGPKIRKEQVEWLKIKHQLAHEDAILVIKKLHEGQDECDEDELINSHFENEKKYLKPVYDLLISSVKDFGKFRVGVNKTYLSLVNGSQFAIFKLTKNGLIVAVAQDAVRAARSKSFCSVKNLGPKKITHKILLNDTDDVNEEVIRVLKNAFKNNQSPKV